MGPLSPALSLALGLLAAAASPAGADECPSPAWIPFGSHCYAFLQEALKKMESIDDARDICKGNASGADIISINNEEENAFILETFKNNWQGPDYVSLGMYFDSDNNTFQWYDKSQVKFTNWIEEEANQELLNTCVSMQTKSGIWKKMSCEDLPLTGILCKKASAYEKEYLPDHTTLTSTLVITFTVVVTIAAALLWFLYKRNISRSSRALCTMHPSTAQVPYSDETVLVDAEENEYIA
uniref:CD302 antigen n=1 Tax=Sphenodon punctatus TaxID=8508 RepID=A0A8D0LB86_SPHPU